MNDAKFVVLATEKSKKRLENFLEYCLENKSKKIECVLLLGPKNENSFAESIIEKYQTENKKISIVRYTTDEPSFKRNRYFRDLDQDTVDNFKWLISIDEDSITNVDGLIDSLNDDFNEDFPAYVCGEIMDNFQKEEFLVAELFEKEYWYNGNSGPLHEWEISCLNNKTMQMMINSEIIKKVFTYRTRFLSGWGDHCLALCLKMLQIYPVQASYMTSTNKIYEHSLLGKKFHHTHYIYENIGIGNIFNFLKLPNFPTIKKAWLKLKEGNAIKDIGVVFLNKDKTITASKEEKKIFGLWNIKNDQIYIYQKEIEEGLLLEKEKDSENKISIWELID